MGAKRLEHVVLEPARVAELEGRAPIRGQDSEKIIRLYY